MTSTQADVESYLSKRTQFINDERSLRRDHANLPTLSSAEKDADLVVREIRAAEVKSVWNDQNDMIPHMFPGMEFLTAKDVITKTKVFRILAKMPKGALLHAHLDAMVNASTLLRLAMQHDCFHVRSPASLTLQNMKSTLPQFKVFPPNQFSDLTSLTETGYPPDEWVPMSKARENFDPGLGGPQGFDDWVLGALTINPAEAYGTHKTTEKIWAKFTSTFLVATNLIRFYPIWYPYIKEFFLSSVEDGISYIEARINFLYKFMTGVDGEENIPHREWLLEFDRAIRDVKAELKEQGREDEFIGARIIYTTIRFMTPEELEWYLEDCIALKQEFPHLIAGFDLVGHEDSLKPLIYYIEPLIRFQKRVKQLGLDIPFIFHAGETLGDGTDADMNLYDAILLGTKRIGHGFSLAKHPKLMEICKKEGIAIEICPISNEILRLTTSMPMHPLPIILNQGIPVALCSDDPAVFGNMGLSFDFFQVLMGSEITGLLTLGQMARDSLEHSTLKGSEKSQAIALWEKRWLKFCEYVAHQGTLAN
ncbi:hypothetical protein JAAARDRAFT_67324 [Jaapia argillacea MUCL 33604]|uniref:adenosine deaminase n=1 Tax=Jaapia argillacea MUCL 33604 TaxID=933084 RepID=A0A067Q434_9AGAM|nr:hypothetical protein JAAARDRAFT_67324 [Jaapia argillacea MUCL 33604]